MVLPGGVIGAAGQTRYVWTSAAGWSRSIAPATACGLMIDQPILVTDTELKAMLRADITFDWYRWHQARLADPAVKARYCSLP